MRILQGDCLKKLAELEPESIDCVITSPPYFGLRDYGMPGQVGLEETPQQYVEKMVEIFRAIRIVLKSEGTVWLNLGDSYVSDSYVRRRGAKDQLARNDEDYLAANREKNGTSRKSIAWAAAARLKRKSLIGIPWRVALALQDDGWILRQDIIWHKPNPMPESVTDRCTKAHEYVFLLSKQPEYYFDAAAIREPSKYPNDDRKSRSGKHNKRMSDEPDVARVRPGSKTYPFRNKRDVWTISTRPFKGAHFAVFPEKLIEPMMLAGCPEKGTVLDPFLGSGTTGIVAKRLGRECIGIELNAEYIKMAETREAQSSST